MIVCCPFNNGPLRAGARELLRVTALTRHRHDAMQCEIQCVRHLIGTVLRLSSPWPTLTFRVYLY